MKELQMESVVELSDFRLQETNGGSIWLAGGAIWPGLVQIGISVLIAEWDSTKQAAIDAWNGTYNPPD